MSFVLRRSLPSLTGLVALLVGVGFLAVAYLDAPLWFPAGFAIAIILLQYAINPRIIQWLIPAGIVPMEGGRYATEHPVGRLLADRCRQAGVPLVKLGIVDDGNPNAFTFGHTRADARIWVTRGLLERLDERELDAVLAHEIGHVRNRDFIVMTVAAVIPMILYLLYISTRSNGRDNAGAIALAAYAGYLVSQFTLLALSRAREYAADHWSCAATGDGDALCSALVKVAYGMGSIDAARKNDAALAVEGAKKRRKRQTIDMKSLRMQSMRAMGIFEPRDAVAMETALAQGIDPEKAIAALRWDMVNPWAKVLEKLSSHPIVAHRFRALEVSGLPGHPRRWSVLRSYATVSPEQRLLARARFGRELVLSLAPWAVMIPLVAFGAFRKSPMTIGAAIAIAGVLFLAKQTMRYPGGFPRAQNVASLLERLDAGPAAGIGVELTGTIIGRGMPGYVLSPDLVIQDESGFVPVIYANSVPFARTATALLRTGHFLGKQATVRGWYRRSPGPAIDLREVTTTEGMKARGYDWIIRYTASVIVILVGVGVLLGGRTAG
ncbi:MAG: protease [Actinobacteria bacterium]|nr:MAG: protease [Actinomycetota bacterium]